MVSTRRGRLQEQAPAIDHFGDGARNSRRSRARTQKQHGSEQVGGSSSNSFFTFVKVFIYTIGTLYYFIGFGVPLLVETEAPEQQASAGHQSTEVALHGRHGSQQHSSLTILTEEEIPVIALGPATPSLDSSAAFNGGALTDVPVDFDGPIIFGAEWHSWSASIYLALDVLLRIWAVLTAIACTALALKHRHPSGPTTTLNHPTKLKTIVTKSMFASPSTTPRKVVTPPSVLVTPLDTAINATLPLSTPGGATINIIRTPTKAASDNRPLSRRTDSAMNTPVNTGVDNTSRDLPALARVQSSPMPSPLRRPIVGRNIINGGPRRLDFAPTPAPELTSSRSQSERSYSGGSVDERGASLAPPAWQLKLEELERELSDVKRENRRLHEQLKEQMAPREDLMRMREEEMY